MTGTMTIRIDEELRAYIDPLTPDEYAALEQSLLAEGCRDALVLWGDLLVDGHNRHAICSKHGIAFNTVQFRPGGRNRHPPLQPFPQTIDRPLRAHYRCCVPHVRLTGDCPL